MSHNPHMTSHERVLWRQIAQAAFEAAALPTDARRAKALAKALSPAPDLRLPDLRPLPSSGFRAFLMMARGFAKEEDAGLRALLAPRLTALADLAGDILDGLKADDGPPPSWTERADLR
ncbi:MAG: hypothetical protein ACK4Z5_03320 [Brevundimonas sp.]